MITYFIKIILCSGLFVSIYKILLENERMHRFNRFYLLASLVCSFIIPFITFTQYVQPLPVLENVLTNTISVSGHTNTQQIISHSEINYQLIIALTIYVTITTLLLFRFAFNLRSVLQRVATNPTIPFKKSKLILIKQSITPHSFLGYIFINTEDYKNGNIEKEILLHEFAHVQQKHSWDILFIEIIQIVFWFNPFVFLYRKALLLNHEFLADEAVINKYNDVSAYQYLLLEKASYQSSSFITSQFNYSITKKTLLMMTKTKSLKNALCKQLAIIPVLGIALFFFSTKTIAQETRNFVSLKKTETPSTKEGITKEQLAEYETIVSKAKTDKGPRAWNKFSDADKSRLQTLFLLMSKEQQAQQIVVFVPAPPPAPKSTPTKKQLNAWKDSKIYGVWINEKRVSNSKLEKYINTDFSQFFVSKLEKNAINYGKHYYQVGLMTNEYYANYYKQAIESKEKYYMGFHMPASK
ncbi:MAG: M56 family metallopeptidase [Ferruginibacter sp.]